MRPSFDAAKVAEQYSLHAHLLAMQKGQLAANPFLPNPSSSIRPRTAASERPGTREGSRGRFAPRAASAGPSRPGGAGGSGLGGYPAEGGYTAEELAEFGVGSSMGALAIAEDGEGEGGGASPPRGSPARADGGVAEVAEVAG